MWFSQLLLAGLFSTFTFASDNAAPTATIDNGVVIGKSTSLPAALGPVNQFLGIPFAQSPPERFSPPKAAPQFQNPIQATSWKPACIQQFQYPLAAAQIRKTLFNTPAPAESEDCLYLNVYAPASPGPASGRAVLFWIFGGSLQFGTGGLAAYDGTSFASYEDVVIVTINYRTNVFGFPSSPELPLTGHNLGFLDQRFALDWVQRNIHAFGGDPKKVAIFGESAGALSVDALLTSYPRDSNPPFRAAILQSGQWSYKPSAPASSVPAWYNLTATLGCPGTYSSNLTCVRAAKATDIQKIIDENSLSFDSIVDNVTSIANPAQARLSGKIAAIPALIGSNANEGRVFTIGQNNVDAFLQGLLGSTPAAALIPAIKAAYPLDRAAGLTNNNDIIAQISGDITFLCPAAFWANASASIGVPTWRYYYNASFTNTQLIQELKLGAYHASEIPMVFRTYPRANTTTQEYALSQYMQSAWARFAKNPNGGPGWNPVGTGAAGRVLFGPYDQVTGGVLMNGNASALKGDWNLGVLGDVGHVLGSGVTVLPQSQVDKTCNVFKPLFEFFVGKGGFAPSG